MLSKLRWAVLFELAKAWKLGLPVPAGRIVRVFSLNSGLVYRFLKQLEAEGVAEPAGKGLWRLRKSGKARALSEYVAGSVPEGPYAFWSANVPEVYYYVAEPPSVEWLGFPERVLVVADEKLKGRIAPPRNYLVVYTSLRGRAWKFDWDAGVSKATAEQALADLLSYDPSYPAEEAVLNGMGSLDLSEVLRRCNRDGFRRLATFLAFFRTATGRNPPAGADYWRSADPKVLRERLGRYVEALFANGVAERRGI